MRRRTQRAVGLNSVARGSVLARVLAFCAVLLPTGCMQTPDAGEVAKQAEAITTSSLDLEILGFESPARDWSSPQTTIGESTNATEGEKALAFPLNGWTQIESAEIGSLGSVQSLFTLDVRLPAAASWGDMQVALRSPGAGIGQWTQLGSISLAGITPGSYQTVRVTLPSAIRAALQGDYDDLRIQLTINGPVGLGPLLLDNVLFYGSDQPGAPQGEDALSEQVELSLMYPAGTILEKALFSASESLKINERVVASQTSTRGTVASFGAFEVHVGAGGLGYADLYARGPVFLGSQTEWNGLVRSAHADIELQDASVIVRGNIDPEVPVPNFSYSWQVRFPYALEPLSTLNSGSVVLPPGAYSELRANGGEYLLSSGVYFFDKFITESGSSIQVDVSAGPVVIYVRNELIYRGLMNTVGGPRGNLLLGWLGTNAAPLQAPFVGTIVAPNGRVELRRPTSGQHEGSFFAREVEVFSDSQVLPLPFPWGEGFPGAPPDRDGDGVPDDEDGCPGVAEKQTRGLVGCSGDDADDDGDLTPNHLDECPDDPNNTIFGACGCAPQTAKPAGTPCVPESCSGRYPVSVGACDGSGVCIGAEGNQCSPKLPDQPGIEGDCREVELEFSHYWTCTGLVTWEHADALCKSEPGRQLARVDSHLEGAWLNRILQGQQAWLGGNDLTNEGEWFWAGPVDHEGRQFWSGDATGQRVAHRIQNWRAGHPASGDCLALANDGTWVSAECSEQKTFVCEQPKKYPTPIDEPPRSCDFDPDVECEDEDPLPVGVCVDPASIGIPTPLGTPASEQQTADQIAACKDACKAPGQPGCATACTGWMTPPTDQGECKEFTGTEKRRCQIDTNPADGFDPSRSCQSSADCNLALGEFCGIYRECAKPEADGELVECTTDAQCAADERCGTTAPYCMKIGVSQPCDIKEGTLCAARCFSGRACGSVHPSCASNDDTELMNLCSEIKLCSPDTQIATTVFDESDPQVTPSQFVPGDFFPGLKEPDAKTFQTAVDELLTVDTPCGVSGFPACDFDPPTEHPWCKYTTRAEDNAAPVGPIAISDDSAALGNKKGSAASGPVSFNFDPNLDVEYDVSSFDPLGESSFEVSALAEAKATASFDLAFLGVDGEFSLLDAQAFAMADRCGVMANAHLKLFGVDLLPLVMCGDTLAALDEFSVTSDVHDACIGQIAEVQELLGRAKKAMRDAQELVRQYHDLAEQGKRFLPTLCERLLGDVAVLPPGFPEFESCDLLSPKEVIGLFINYYRYEVEQLVRRQQDLLEGKIAEALPNFKYSVPFGDHDGIIYVRDENGGRTEDVGSSLCDDSDAKESQPIANVPFAIGPIPMNLSIDAYLGYGVNGALDFELDTAAVAKALLPEPGVPTQRYDLASAAIHVTPWAAASIEVFVGAGFDFGPVGAKVGIAGDLTLGTVHLPAQGKAALTIEAEVDTRPPPSDFLGIMPSYTLLFPAALPQKLRLDASYRFGLDYEIANVLEGDISAKARIKFFFFSKTWQVEILRFGPAVTIPPKYLIFFETGSTLADLDTPLAQFQVPIPFPNFGEILGLPDLPPYNPREFDGVRSLQTTGEIHPDDPRYVDFDSSRVQSLFYDGFCGDPLPACLDGGEECSEASLGCCGELSCVGDGHSPSTCKTCSEQDDSCGTHDDCCSDGYARLKCLPDPYGAGNFCERCRPQGQPAVDEIPGGGCCDGLVVNRSSPAFPTCEECGVENDECSDSSQCCGRRSCRADGTCSPLPPPKIK